MSSVLDEALIIDPTLDDPLEHLVFRADGIVTATSEKGRQSIRVYALNRAELVFERLGLARLIEQRLTIIEALAAIIADPALPAVLFASDLGRPVYERMGYLPISRATVWLGGLTP